MISNDQIEKAGRIHGEPNVSSKLERRTRPKFQLAVQHTIGIKINMIV